MHDKVGQAPYQAARIVVVARARDGGSEKIINRQTGCCVCLIEFEQVLEPAMQLAALGCALSRPRKTPERPLQATNSLDPFRAASANDTATLRAQKGAA